MSSEKFSHDDTPIIGSAERWNTMGPVKKYGGAVVALVRSVAGNPRMDDQRDADRRAAFYQRLRDTGDLRRAADVVNSQGLIEMPDGMPPQPPQSTSPNHHQ